MVAIRSRVCRRKLEWLHYVAPCGSDRFAGCREGELARQTTCGWPRQGWTRQGEWRFDPAQWPDPAGLVAELDRLGVKLMVSVWPTVNPASENYAEMEDLGLLVGSERASACTCRSGTRARLIRQWPATTTPRTPGPGVHLVQGQGWLLQIRRPGLVAGCLRARTPAASS